MNQEGIPTLKRRFRILWDLNLDLRMKSLIGTILGILTKHLAPLLPQDNLQLRC